MTKTSDVYRLFHVTSLCFQHISDELRRFKDLNSHQSPEVVTEDSKWTTAERELLRDAVLKFADSVENIDKKLEAKISAVSESSETSPQSHYLDIATARDLEILSKTSDSEDSHVAHYAAHPEVDTKSK
ncbi:hypothetical protein GJ496_009560 [Pomphorhynchus laevis]|nr:hypothetical protein GJ496_009560 [Pomphorhynchus laevis]